LENYCLTKILIVMLKNYLSKLLAFAVLFLAANYLQAQFATVTVTSPAGVAGDYYGKVAAFGPAWTLTTGTVVLVDDGAGSTNGCNTIANDVSGKIAMIDRGTCGFVNKVYNADTLGAIAVIICNNSLTSPYGNIVMGDGGANPGVTIPSLMLSYADCQTIKSGLPGVEVSIDLGVPDALPGERCENPIVVTPGTYTVDSITTGLGGIFAGAGNAVWYEYTPSATVLATVSSCGGVDSRVYVGTACGGADFAGDDECADANGDITSAEVSWLAVGGTTYYIHFDDRWTDDGFDWTLSEGTPPDVAVTFNVDMQFETTDPAGVYIAGTFNNWTPELMTDNGNDTWSFTADVEAGSEVQWIYLNGPTGIEDGDLSACGVVNPLGGYLRAEVINSLEPVVLDLVCFNLCAGCIPTDCDVPIVVFEDDIDSYTTGPIGPQAPQWSTWSGTVGGAEDGTVSTEQFSSAPNSLKLTGGGSQDVILLLGEKTSGHYVLSWKMFIPATRRAYYNLQHFEVFGAPNGQWAIEIAFDANNQGALTIGGGTVPFSYPNGEWFDVIHYIDLDNDQASLYLNNQHLYSWPFSWQGGSQTGALSLGAVNFYPRTATDVYYIDDVYYAAIPPAADGNYCYTATPVDLGVHTAPGVTCFGGPDQENAPGGLWYSYTATEDGFIYVGSCGAGVDTRVWIFSGDCQGTRSTVGVNDDECEMTAGGDLYASYREAAVTAGETYYIVWDDRWEDSGFEWELGFFSDIYPGDFCSTAQEVDYGQHTIEYFSWASVSGPQLGAFGGYTPYTNSKWFSFTPTANATVRAYSCGLTGEDTRIWVYTGDCSSFETLEQVATNDDDCGLQSDLTWDVTAGTTYYIEWDDLGDDIAAHDWILEEIIPTITVNFQVDLTYYLAAGNTLETVKIAGNFADNAAVGVPNWDPPSSPVFTDLGNDVWGTSIEFPVTSAGQELLYKFLNTANSWGDCNVQQECLPTDAGDCRAPGNDGNRIFTIPSANETVCYTWDTCLGCNVVSTKELIELPMTIAPNPFSNRTVVSFNQAIVDGQVRLTSLTGQLVRTYKVNAPQLIIEKDGMTPGIYFLNVVTENGTSVAQKLIVQ
jgi:hypothetical protein